MGVSRWYPHRFGDGFGDLPRNTPMRMHINPEKLSRIKAKAELLERDWDSTVRRARYHSSLLQVSDKLVVNEWHGVWDEALA